MPLLAALLLLSTAAPERPSAHLLEHRLALRQGLFDTGGGADDVGGDAGEWFVEGLAGFGAILAYGLALGFVGAALILSEFSSSGTGELGAFGIIIIVLAGLTAPLISAWVINAVADSYGQPTSFARTALFGYGAWLLTALLSSAAGASGSQAFASGIGLVTFFGFFAAQVYAANTYWPDEEDEGGGAPRPATVRLTVARF